MSSRRQFLGLLAGTAATGIFAQVAGAQEQTNDPTPVCVFAGPEADLGPTPQEGSNFVYLSTDTGRFYHSLGGTEWSKSAVETRLTPSTHVNSDTVTDGERYIRVDSSSAAITVTLGESDTVESSMVTIKDVAGAAGTNNITLQTEGDATIDGSTSGTLDADYQTVEVRYAEDTNEWEVTNITYTGGSAL